MQHTRRRFGVPSRFTLAGAHARAGTAPTPAEVAARFVKADKARMAELLATLASFEQASERDGKFGAV